MKHFTFTGFLATALIGTLLAACQVKPSFINKTLPTGPPSSGQTLTFQVGLDQPASGTQAVNITTSAPSQFNSIPSVIYVPDGYTTQTFQATLKSTATGDCLVIAACNGTSVDYEIPQIND